MVTAPKNSTSTHTLRLYSDASGMVKGLNAVDRELADVVKQLDRAQAASAGATTSMNGMATSAKNLTQTNRRLRAGAQNVAYQFQDIAVQAEMGIAPMRILVQQGSQIAGVFGMWPSIITAAAGVLYLLADATGVFTSDAVDLDEAMKGLSATFKEFNEANEALKDAVGDSTLSPFMRQVIDGELEAALDAMIEKLDLVTEGIKTSFSDAGSGWIASGLGEYLDRIDELQAGLAGFAASGWANTVTANTAEIARLTADIDDNFGLSYEKAVAIRDAIENWDIAENSGDLDAQVTAAAALEKTLKGSKGASEEMHYMWLQALRTFRELVNLQEAEKASAKAIAENNKILIDGTYNLVLDFMAAIKERMSDAIRDHYDAEEAASDWDKALKAVNMTAEDLEIVLNAITGLDLSKVFSDAEVAAGNLLKKANGIWYAMSELAQQVKAEQLDAFGGLGDPVVPAWGETEWERQQRLDAERKANRKGGGSKKQSDDQKELKKSIEDTMKAMDEQIRLAGQWGTAWDDIMSNTVSTAFDDFFDGLANGELKFKEFTKNILRDLFKISAQAFVTQMLLSAIGVVPGMKASEATQMQSIMGNAFGFEFAAKGMALNNGSKITPFAKGGVVDGPTMFPMSSGAGIMGEAGPEAIMPLSRGSDGKLGVAGPNIVINNYSGQEVTVDRSEETIAIAVGRARQAIQNDFQKSMTTGQGTYARSMEGGYLARRKAV